MPIQPFHVANKQQTTNHPTVHKPWIMNTKLGNRVSERDRNKKPVTYFFKFMWFYHVELLFISLFFFLARFTITTLFRYESSYSERLFTASKWHSRSWIKEIVFLQVLLTSWSRFTVVVLIQICCFFFFFFIA